MGDVTHVVSELLKAKPTNNVYNLSSVKSHEVLDLAKIVQKSFYDKYYKEIDIKINHSDLSKYEIIYVKNKKKKIF